MTSFRARYLTKPIHRWAKGALPRLSDTESEAMQAGEVWWEAELFSGNPDWSKLRDVRAPELTSREQAFLDNQCEAFCAMIDDWSINRYDADLPEEVWQLLRDEKFFGIILPEEYGGLGFSAFAHSEIVRFISTRSVAAAVTVMVPNSLGPGELLHIFGTEAQKDYWMPRLARGEEIPAFGLTSEEAGSDASAMVDTGIVEEGTWNGETVLGIRLNWSKRYITLAPVCTVLGLAFQLRDPHGHLGGEEDIGITCALVPSDLPGVEKGRRHIPSDTMFMNGPITGTDVFVPLDHIIGGPEHAGRGWMMLMSALAAGRGISLPSMACAAISLSAHTAGAYSRIREQFGVPIGKFGGIQEKLGGLAADAYSMDAARRLTCAGLDEGRALSVVSAIMKSHATYRMRDAINDAMDVHSGKAVIDGPSNYLQALYRAVPIGITVEGANIVTRSLIIFGQGSIRAHPHILEEMKALGAEDETESLEAFDRHFWAHVTHATKTVFRALGRAWSGGRLAPAPDAGPVTDIYKRLSRWSAAYALTAEMAFLTIGGGLKRREMISGRMGDILSEMFILSATLKRWEDEGRQETDLPVVRYAAESAFHRIQTAMNEVLANFPSRWAAGFVRLVTLPGSSQLGPDDTLTEASSDLIYEPSAARDRIVGRVHGGCARDGITVLNAAYAKVTGCAALMKRLREAGQDPQAGLKAGTITQDEHDRIEDMRASVRDVVAVDDFTPEALGEIYAGLKAGQDRKEAAE